MLANWVKESTATTGTGTITLGGAVAGFAAFSAAFTDGEKVSYAIEDGDNREIGVGTYNAGTLTRDTVLETLVGGVSSTNGTAITLSGTAEVFVTPSAERLNSRVGGDGSVTDVRKMTQAEYDALATKDATTLYVIVG